MRRTILRPVPLPNSLLDGPTRRVTRVAGDLIALHERGRGRPLLLPHGSPPTAGRLPRAGHRLAEEGSAALAARPLALPREDR